MLELLTIILTTIFTFYALIFIFAAAYDVYSIYKFEKMLEEARERNKYRDK